MSQVKRTKADDVLAFMEQFARVPEAESANPQPLREATAELRGTRFRSPKTVEAKLWAFRAELERVEPYFKPGKRQHLVMALTAFGTRGLSLPDEVILCEIEAFLHAIDNDELPDRLEAIRRTLNKHRFGKLVAWKHFYELAEVSVPFLPHSAPTPAVLACIEQASQLLSRNVWEPRSGKTACAVFAALLTFATDFGREHESGFVVSVSTRDLALKAGRSHPTVLKALRRLADQGLIRSERARRPEDAGVLVVLMHKVTKLYHSSGAWGGLKEWSKLYTHQAFRHACLNKSAIDPLAVLLDAKEGLTRSEIAKRLGKKSRVLTKPLAKLLEYSLVVETDRRYKVADDWEVALDLAARKTGALAAEQRDRDLYEVQREVFKRRLARKRNMN